MDKVHPTHINPEDGGSMFLQNVDNVAHIHPRTESTSAMNHHEA
jgi:hypothetical protein